MAKLYLVRHADAGNRASWAGHDRERPLSDRGRRQADRLRDHLAEAGVTRLVASPFTRCVQTLEPLGALLGLGVTSDDRLAEGASALDALALASETQGRSAALCSHGDVIPDLLDELVRRGCKLRDELRWQKASTWMLTWEGTQLTKGRYLPPPH